MNAAADARRVVLGLHARKSNGQRASILPRTGFFHGTRSFWRHVEGNDDAFERTPRAVAVALGGAAENGCTLRMTTSEDIEIAVATPEPVAIERWEGEGGKALGPQTEFPSVRSRDQRQGRTGRDDGVRADAKR